MKVQQRQNGTRRIPALLLVETVIFRSRGCNKDATDFASVKKNYLCTHRVPSRVISLVVCGSNVTLFITLIGAT